MRVSVLTVSDRSAAGEREDQSGPLIESMMAKKGWQVRDRTIVPDEMEAIQAELVQWADEDQVDLVLTTGGTGFAPRDRTPEATRQVCDRMAPGLAEAMRAASLKVTPHAMLSRAVAGIRNRTLIVNLPGSPKAVRENLQVLLPVLPHAIEILRDQDVEAGPHPPQQRHNA